MVSWLCRQSSNSSSSKSITKNKCLFLWLSTLFVYSYGSAANTVHDLAKIQFEPKYIHDLFEGQNTTVYVKVLFDENEFLKSPYFNKSLRISVKTLHNEVATSDISYLVINLSHLIAVNDSFEYNFNTNIDSHMMGKTALQVRLISIDNAHAVAGAGEELFEFMEYAAANDDEIQSFGSELKPVEGASRMDLWVKREEDGDKLTKLFVLTLIFLLTIANILMGCELNLITVLSTIKSLTPPAIGCVTQFLLMPLIAYTISHFILLPRGLNSFALGLFVTSCSPGGSASNFWTLLLEGNVNLSITMTFISTVASLVLIPFWMNILGHKFLQGSTDGVHVKVPYLNIVSALLILIVPLLIGIAIAKFKPNIAAKAKKILRPFIIFVLIFVITFGTLLNLYMFKLLTWPALLAGFLLPWCGFMFGCFSALIFGQKPANVTAIAIETGVQNTGIAIMLLKFSFQQPDADISSLIPVIVACFTPFPILLGYGVHLFIKSIKNRKTPLIDLEKETPSVSFNTKTSKPFTTIKSPTTSSLSSKVQDGCHQSLIHHYPTMNQGNMSSSFEESLTEEEKVKYMEEMFEQGCIRGAIPE
uniref:PIN-like protein n=1 Tax=Panagrolaimus sp. ES5 TaxID=591445 RepID=A0AC34FKD8_9BILA